MDLSNSEEGIKQPYRNSSPVPDTGLDISAACVGETSVSSHFVCSTLMDFIKFIEKTDLSNSYVVDLPEDLEENLCVLWDLAMVEDVALFLVENDVPELLTTVLLQCRSPRGTEIGLGILSNLACHTETLVRISSQSALRGAVFGVLLTSVDAQSLSEACRLSSICLASDEVSSIWLKDIREMDEDGRILGTALCERAVFFLSNSTLLSFKSRVVSLLDSILSLMDKSELPEDCVSDVARAFISYITDPEVDEDARNDAFRSLDTSLLLKGSDSALGADLLPLLHVLRTTLISISEMDVIDLKESYVIIIAVIRSLTRMLQINTSAREELIKSDGLLQHVVVLFEVFSSSLQKKELEENIAHRYRFLLPVITEYVHCYLSALSEVENSTAFNMDLLIQPFFLSFLRSLPACVPQLSYSSLACTLQILAKLHYTEGFQICLDEIFDITLDSTPGKTSESSLQQVADVPENVELTSSNNIV